MYKRPQEHYSQWRLGIMPLDPPSVAIATDSALHKERDTFVPPADIFDLRVAIMNAGEWPRPSNTPPDNTFVIADFRKAFPYRVEILSPFTRVVLAQAEAARKFEPAAVPDFDALNHEGVIVNVLPALSRAAKSIQGVVLKKAGEVIRPAASSVQPTTLTNNFGASLTYTVGRFAFPLDGFRPNENLTIVLIGDESNVEWTLNKRELEILR